MKKRFSECKQVTILSVFVLLCMVVGITEHHPSFRIGAYTFGGARDIWTTEKLRVAIGGDVTFYSKPAPLDAIYGNNPASYRFFFRFRPGKTTMAQMHDTR